MVDAGANHGIYGLYSAALGAQVVAIEPQAHVAALAVAAWRAYAEAHLGGNTEARTRFQMIHGALLDRNTSVHLHGNIADIVHGHAGGMANVREAVPGVTARRVATARLIGWQPAARVHEHYVRDAAHPPPGAVIAMPLSVALEVASIAPSARIHFLKIDVEGSELSVLRSIEPLLATQQVEHVLMEFGPVNRWQSVDTCGLSCEQVALDMLRRLELVHGMQVRLLCGVTFPTGSNRSPELSWRSFCHGPLSQHDPGLPHFVSLNQSEPLYAALFSELRRRDGYLWLCNKHRATGCSAVALPIQKELMAGCGAHRAYA